MNVSFSFLAAPFVFEGKNNFGGTIPSEIGRLKDSLLRMSLGE